MVNNPTSKKLVPGQIYNLYTFVVDLIYIKFEPNFTHHSAKWRIFAICFWMIAAVILAASHGRAQVPAGEGQVSIPTSSTEQPGDTGVQGTPMSKFSFRKGRRMARAPVGGRWRNSSGSGPRAGRGERLRPTAVIPSKTGIR